MRLRSSAPIAFWFCWILLLNMGCEEPQPVTVERIVDAQVQIDAGIELPDSETVPADSAMEVMDASVTADATIVVTEGCRVPVGAEVSRPTADQVQVLYTGFNSVLVWSDERGVHACDVDAEGRFTGEHTFLVEESTDTPFQVKGARVGPYAYVAISKDDSPIQILRLDRPSSAPIRLVDGEAELYAQQPFFHWECTRSFRTHSEWLYWLGFA